MGLGIFGAGPFGYISGGGGGVALPTTYTTLPVGSTDLLTLPLTTRAALVTLSMLAPNSSVRQELAIATDGVSSINWVATSLVSIGPGPFPVTFDWVPTVGGWVLRLTAPATGYRACYSVLQSATAPALSPTAFLVPLISSFP